MLTMSHAEVRASEGTRRYIKGGQFMPPRQRRGSPEGRSVAHYSGSSEEFPVPAKKFPVFGKNREFRIPRKLEEFPVISLF